MPEPTEPQANPATVDAIFDRLRLMNDQLELFHAARVIAENPALLSSKAVEQIRRLYAEFDTRHPQQQEPA